MAVNVGRGKTSHITYRKKKTERKRPGPQSHFQRKHPLTQNFLLDSTSYIFIKHANARLQTNTVVQGTLGNFKRDSEMIKQVTFRITISPSIC
jgi:hypothetical protein